jgi:hypothetical protein
MNQPCTYVGKVGEIVNGRITWGARLSTRHYLLFGAFALVRTHSFFVTLSTDSRLLPPSGANIRLGRLNIWRLGDLVGDDMGHVTSLGLLASPINLMSRNAIAF